jgi:hypothetical protein
MDDSESGQAGAETASPLPQTARKKTGRNGRPAKHFVINAAVANQRIVKSSRLKLAKWAGQDVGKTIRQTFERMLAEPAGVKTRPESKLEVICRNVLEGAMSGSISATEIVFDRVDGKPGRVQRATDTGGSVLDRYEDLAKSQGITPDIVKQENKKLEDFVNRMRAEEMNRQA